MYQSGTGADPAETRPLAGLREGRAVVVPRCTPRCTAAKDDRYLTSCIASTKILCYFRVIETTCYLVLRRGTRSRAAQHTPNYHRTYVPHNRKAAMDVDVFTEEHQAEWDRLRALTRRSGRLSGAEADELIHLYQRAATHLSMVRSAAPDPVLTDRLTMLVSQARAATTGTPAGSWRDIGVFFAQRFPAAVYRAAPWWIPTAVLFLLVSGLIAAWVAGNPAVQSAISAPEEIAELTRPGGDFEAYYSSEPAASFAAQVWTNNAYIAAASLVVGILLLPVVFILLINAANVGVAAGLMASAGRLDVFFGLITPHGLLELTAVFVAAGAGLRLGWTLIDPGPRPRTHALAQEGRTVAGLAIGLAVVLLISGIIEAFVTPSPMNTAARVGIGVAAEAAFLAYVFVLGRRAAHAGVTGDISARSAGDALRVSA